MADSAGDRIRDDPYRNFKFRLSWDGRHIAGFNKLAPLKPLDKTIGHSPASSAGTPGPRRRPKNEAVTLERGLTHDTEFEQWARDARAFDSDPTRTPAGPRLKDIQIEAYDEAGRLTAMYKLFRCWVSEYQAVADLDANANAVAIEHLKLEHEGFERDHDVPTPDEP